MQKTDITGVYKDKSQIFTENIKESKGVKVYNEKIVKQKNKEFRSWNPYRSKLAAAILNGLEFKIKKDSNILYLGAATGTTVSHISDICKNGMIFTVENSPFAMKKLVNLCKNRPNIIPIFEDANHPDRYSSIVNIVDILYQDISQRNQADIFIKNIKNYLKEDGIGIFMVKARSIDVSLKPKETYDLVCSQLEKNRLKINSLIDLIPFEKDHAVIFVSK
ncbi:MAG: fibrillarin-like rRNA/tRNA 2'-O-methyltransferase [Thermoplasmatales archaeon]|nr:MAG: fibrillarin-like rRNA/tRNA 2'-O-methyltransferase [Thermoplasmatales archaeon]